MQPDTVVWENVDFRIDVAVSRFLRCVSRVAVSNVLGMVKDFADWRILECMWRVAVWSVLEFWIDVAMSDVTTYVGRIGGWNDWNRFDEICWGEICCIDNCCWDAKWNVN